MQSTNQKPLFVSAMSKFGRKPCECQRQKFVPIPTRSLFVRLHQSALQQGTSRGFLPFFSKFNRTSRQNSTFQGFRYPSPFPYRTGPEVWAGFIQSRSNMQRSNGRSRGSVWNRRVVGSEFALLRTVWWYTISCIKPRGFVHKWLLHRSHNLSGSSRTQHKPRGPVQIPTPSKGTSTIISRSRVVV